MSSQARQKICRQCFAYVDSGRMTCPHCGLEFPPSDTRPVTESPEELVKRSLEPEDARRAFYDKMVALARSRGYKPGFGAAKFKERYGEWSPRLWSEETAAKFASDLLWQDSVTRRAKTKEVIDTTPSLSVESDDDPASLGSVEFAEEANRDEDFLNWYERQ